MTNTLTPRADASPLIIKSSQWEKYVGQFIPDHVRSGFTVSAGAGLNLTVAIGEAWIKGLNCASDATNSILLAASNTNYVYITIARDGNSEPTSWSITSNTTGVTPADSMLIATATTNVSSITGTADKRIMKVDDYVGILPMQASDPTLPADGSTTIFYVKQDDSNNWSLLAYLKKAGAMTLVRVA